MVNLKRLLKPYKDAGAAHSLFAPQRFVDDRVFLTKSNHVGVVAEVEGVDPECLTDETLESYTRRTAGAWRSFDERVRIYQYVIKEDGVPVQCGTHADPVVRETVGNRVEYLAAKPEGLYSVRLFYAVLFEPSAVNRRFGLANKKAVRILAAELQRYRDTLIGNVEAFRRNLGDLLGVRILSKAEAFAFFRLLTNLDPEISAAERLKHDSPCRSLSAELAGGLYTRGHSHRRCRSGSAFAEGATGEHVPECTSRVDCARDEFHSVFRVQACAE